MSWSSWEPSCSWCAFVEVRALEAAFLFQEPVEVHYTLLDVVNFSLSLSRRLFKDYEVKYHQRLVPPVADTPRICEYFPQSIPKSWTLSSSSSSSLGRWLSTGWVSQCADHNARTGPPSRRSVFWPRGETVVHSARFFVSVSPESIKIASSHCKNLSAPFHHAGPSV